VIDAILDLLADRFHEAVRPVAFERVSRCQEVTAGRRQEMPGRIYARADMLAGIDAVAGDLRFDGSVVSPSFRVAEMTISGN